MSSASSISVASVADDDQSIESLPIEAPVSREASARGVLWSFCLLGMVFVLVSSSLSDFGLYLTKRLGRRTKNGHDLNSASEDFAGVISDSLESLAERLSPREVDVSPNMTLSQRQFLHLHHMKTAGTSLDTLLQCAMTRLKTQGYRIPYYNIHECGPDSYHGCLSGHNQRCRNGIKSSAFMSYCAPIKDLPVFGWNKELDQFDAVTVLRRPVDRVWSMYRFRTKSGYECRPLKDLYVEIDAGTSDLQPVFKDQLLDHQTRNLLPPGAEGKDDELVDMAIFNLQNFFTMVGLTEDMPTTSQMIAHVFPWMAPTVPGSNQTCDMPHKNASPLNNRCGPDNTHWDLPDHPDEETTRLIEEHNQLDMRVYEAAVQHFVRQQRALGLS